VCARTLKTIAELKANQIADRRTGQLPANQYLNEGAEREL
jgi:hypothetical protein